MDERDRLEILGFLEEQWSKFSVYLEIELGYDTEAAEERAEEIAGLLQQG